MSTYLQQQIEARQSAWHAAKALLDGAAAEKRDLTAEEEQSYARMMADIDTRGQRIADLEAAEARAAQIAAQVAEMPELRTAPAPAAQAVETDAEIIRSLANGTRKTHTFERRVLNTSDDSQVVPQDFLNRVEELMLYTGPMLNGAYITRINTTNGRDLLIPTEATRPSGTATAEAAEFGVSEGTFGQLTLRAWKFGTLVVVSREMIDDTGIDLVSFLGRQLGTALGTAVNSALTLGTGTVQPLGISAAATTAGATGGTGVAGVPTFDNLIDLVHSVDTAYAMSPSAAFMMNRATLGAVRKLKESTSGAYLYSPAASVGTPDRILGYPVLENPYVPATGTNAKSVLFGDMSSFITRVQGGIEIARSDEAYFTSDSVAFRARVLVDGALGQVLAVKSFQGGTA